MSVALGRLTNQQEDFVNEMRRTKNLGRLADRARIALRDAMVMVTHEGLSLAVTQGNNIVQEIDVIKEKISAAKKMRDDNAIEGGSQTEDSNDEEE